MKQIIICDDNAIERQILYEMLREYCLKTHHQHRIIEYDRGETLVADIEEEHCHAELIFLDIYMNGMNGIETARKLRELHCDAKIVFLTSTSDYALESYDVWASGYLVKPLDMKKLCTLLNHIYWAELRKRIEIKYGKQYRYPYLSDIMYIEGEAHKATLHLVDGSQLSTIEKISSLKERLGDDCFLQCHQSYLVNMDYIADIQKDIIMEDGQIIPVSVRRRTETIAYYHKFFNTHYVEV